MPHPDQSIVRRILKENDRDLLLRQAIDTAWMQVKKEFPDAAWWRRKTTRAGLVWEYAVNEAIAALEKDKGVNIVPHDDTVSFIFGENVLLRIKKADLRLTTRNYPTSQALLFHEHDVDLFGYVGMHRVQVAYVENTFGTALDWIGVVAQNKSHKLWRFELGIEETMTEVLSVFPDGSNSSKGVLKDKKTKIAQLHQDTVNE